MLTERDDSQRETNGEVKRERQKEREDTKERNGMAERKRSSDLRLMPAPFGGEEQTLAGGHRADARFLCSEHGLKVWFGKRSGENLQEGFQCAAPPVALQLLFLLLTLTIHSCETKETGKKPKITKISTRNNLSCL